MPDQIYTPSEECVGVDVETSDGKASYDARDGVITVANREHANLIRQQLGVGGKVYAMGAGLTLHACADCGSEMLRAFGPTCWRCRGNQ